MKDHIDTILETTTPQQTAAKREQVFARVMNEVTHDAITPTSVPSPYVPLSTFFKQSRVYIALLLLVILGTGGTVAASESAKPGDLLFPIERATEQLRLALASEEKRVALEAIFLDKRFAEVNEVLSEEVFASTSDDVQLVTEAGEIRIASAIAVLLDQAERFNDEEQSNRLRNLLRDIETLRVEGRAVRGEDGEGRIRIDDDRIEMRTEAGRVRVDDIDGEMRVKYDDDNDDKEDERYQGDDTSESSSDNQDDEAKRDVSDTNEEQDEDEEEDTEDDRKVSREEDDSDDNTDNDREDDRKRGKDNDEDGSSHDDANTGHDDDANRDSDDTNRDNEDDRDEQKDDEDR